MDSQNAFYEKIVEITNKNKNIYTDKIIVDENDINKQNRYIAVMESYKILLLNDFEMLVLNQANKGKNTLLFECMHKFTDYNVSDIIDGLYYKNYIIENNIITPYQALIQKYPKFNFIITYVSTEVENKTNVKINKDNDIYSKYYLSYTYDFLITENTVKTTIDTVKIAVSW
jgi:hypothetical protein